MEAEQPKRPMLDRYGWVAVAFVALTAVSFYRSFYDVGLVGWDSYPLIAASRVRTWADLGSVLSTPMLGRESGGIYYRPLPKLSLALDHALWGLDARGFHATDALIFAAAALALYGLARCLLGTRGRLGAMAALACFLLHPVHATVVPVPSRRPDMMCLLFMCLCLTAVVHAVRRCGTARSGGRTASLAAGAAGGLALLSKETALVLPALAWLTAFVFCEERPCRRRIARASVVLLPLLVVTVLVIATRVAILGGLVGARPMRQAASGAELIGAFCQMGGRLLEGLLSGPAMVGAGQPPLVTSWLLAAAAVTLLTLGLQRRRTDTADAAARTTAVACAWTAALVVTYTVGLILQPWYLLNALAALSLLVGAVVSTLVRLARGGPRGRIVAAVGAAVLVASSGDIVAYSPLLRRYDEWHRATAIEVAYLDALHARLQAAVAGSVLDAPLPPMLLPKAGGQDQLVGVGMLAPYSMQGWADLVLPRKRIRVAYGPNADATADSDGIVLVISGPPARPSRPGRTQGM